MLARGKPLATKGHCRPKPQQGRWVASGAGQQQQVAKGRHAKVARRPLSLPLQALRLVMPPPFLLKHTHACTCVHTHTHARIASDPTPPGVMPKAYTLSSLDAFTR
jgi:hypothetical protein